MRTARRSRSAGRKARLVYPQSREGEGEERPKITWGWVYLLFVHPEVYECNWKLMIQVAKTNNSG